jgi:hypothetical protein
MDGCEPPCGCWDLNSGRLEEQSVLLPTELSRQPQLFFFFKSHCVCLPVFSKEEIKKEQGRQEKSEKSWGRKTMIRNI